MARPVLDESRVREFRDRLCEAALRLFAERGFEAVTLRALAAELDCSYATPYRYFSGKEEIFAALRDLCFRRFAEFLDERTAGITDPRERCRVLALSYLAFAREQPHAFSIMFELGQPDPDAYPEFRTTADATWEVFQQATADLVATGKVDAKVEEIAHLSWASMHGIATLHAAGRLIMGMSADEIAEPMIDAIMAAYATTETPKGQAS